MHIKQLLAALALVIVFTIAPITLVSATDPTQTTSETVSTATATTAATSATIQVSAATVKTQSVTQPTVTTQVAETPDSNEDAAVTPGYPRINLVAEPDKAGEGVYYYKNGKKLDPASFTWVEDAVSGNNDTEKVDTALKFDDATQYVRLASAHTKKLTEFTLSMWVKWDGATDGFIEQRLLTLYNDAHRDRYILLFPTLTGNEGQNGLTLCVNDPRIDPIELYHKTPDNVTSALRANEWHHLALTMSDAEIALYVDGAPFASHQFEEGFSFASMGISQFILGSDVEGATFQGLMDRTMLFEKAYSASEIAWFAQCKLPPDSETAPPTKQEILATASTNRTTANNLNDSPDASSAKQTTRILGMSPVVFAVLGCCVVVIILLSFVLNIYLKNTRMQPEEDHP